MRVRKSTRRRCSELSQKRPETSNCTWYIVRCKRYNWVLDGRFRCTHILFSIMSDFLGTIFVERHSDRLFIIESHRIGIRKNKWCDVFTTVRTPNCALANCLCNGFRIGCPAMWAFSIDKGIASEFTFNRFIISRSEERRVGKECMVRWWG